MNRISIFFCILLLPAWVQLQSAELRVLSPLDYQVIQRTTQTKGTIRFAGQLSIEVPQDAIFESRLIGSQTTIAPIWKSLAAKVAGRDITGQLEAPAGGWWKLETRISHEGNVIASSCVEHVGVGEVFVVAGQSNSANHGEEKLVPQSGRVAAFDGTNWRLALDPQPGASGAGGSFIPAFGDAVVAQQDVPVGIVACGIGATSVREWLPKGAQFPNPPTLVGRVEQLPSGQWVSKGAAFDMLISRMKPLGPNGFRAVLWHQGESDANQKDPTRTLAGRLYREYLEQLIRQSRRAIGWEVPWFVAQVSYHVPGDEASLEIRDAQASLWKDGVAIEGPDSDALKGDLRERGGMGVHFSGKGLREHGTKWAEKVLPWLDLQWTATQKVSSHVIENQADQFVSEAPNIVLILADDLGYGDVGCYNDQSKVATPNLDRLAREGMRFADAHSPCTVCTPTRYSLMTGQMPFRVPNGGTVFTGVGGPSLIARDRLTLPKMLRDKGYATACVGKWHVGLTFFDSQGQPVRGNGVEAVRQVDFTRRVEGGPVDHGFESFFGTACCPTTDWLYAFIENDRVPVPPSVPLDKSALPKHPYANDCRPGLIAPNFPMEEVDLVFLKKSQEFLEQHVRQSPKKPFFLYHATQAVHLPSFAAKRFQGQSKAGPHGDFIVELDYIVGELMATLERLNVADNTLFIFTSDNGPEVASVIHMRADHAHDGARPWRGIKRDNWEGGHRVPLIVRWPGKVPANGHSSQLTSLTDIMGTLAGIIGATLPENAAEDSFNMLPAWLDENHPQIRPYLLVQAFGGKRTLSIRKGPWKYLDHSGSGGNRYENDSGLKAYMLPETAPNAPGQLYNLALDPGETTNLYEKEPSVVTELKALIEQAKSAGGRGPL